MLEHSGMEQKNSHATSIAITRPLSRVSVIFYAAENSFNISEALPLIPSGLIGAAVGSFVLKKVSNRWLKIIFGVFLIISGGRLLFK